MRNTLQKRKKERFFYLLFCANRRGGERMAQPHKRGWVVGIIIRLTPNNDGPETEKVFGSWDDAEQFLAEHDQLPWEKQSGMEFFTRILTSTGLELDPGAGPHTIRGKEMFAYDCDGCGKTTWWTNSHHENVAKTFCEDCNV